MYNNALLVNADCRTKDGLDYIRREFRELEKPYKDATDDLLENLFKGTW